MTNKLYVGGLNYDTTEESLSAYFSEAGTVSSVNIIVDKMTNRSKGFGFVEMGSEEEAQKAIEMFNQKEFEGRRLNVSEARPQKPRNDFGGGNQGGFNNQNNW